MFSDLNSKRNNARFLPIAATHIYTHTNISIIWIDTLHVILNAPQAGLYGVHYARVSSTYSMRESPML